MVTGWVVDTNVWSETANPQGSPAVVRWMAERHDRVHMTLVTVAELRYGVERLPDGQRKAALSEVIDALIDDVRAKGRLLPLTEADMRVQGAIRSAQRAAGVNGPGGGDPSFEDALVAAVARTRGLAVATRNTKHFEHAGVEVVSPWE